LEILDIIVDTVMDSLKLLPFLFLTYLAMEYLEHRAGEGAQRLLGKLGKSGQGSFSHEKSGRAAPKRGGAVEKAPGEKGKAGFAWSGPVAGGLLGVVPQCGFSAAASNLYAGRVITLGTLIAVYLSTSDEMLPILVSERAPWRMILGILLTKAAIGMAAGLGIDFLLHKAGVKESERIHDICEHEHCHCERGIFRSALSHTLQIALFILLVTFVLNLVLHFVGEDVLERLILNRPVLGAVLAGIVGLIPNCAGSVVLTQLYLEGAMGLGAMMAGLLANSGVGILVLFRVNHDRKENLKILGLLYGIGVTVGIVMGLLPGVA